MKKYNLCKIPLGRGLFALVDQEDYLKVNSHSWHIASIKKPYPARTIKKDGKSIIEFLHRAIMTPPKGVFVDHVDGDRLDNRKCNLRLCSEIQNRWNKKQNIGTSKFKGVFKKGGKWASTISANGVKEWLGLFDTEIEAAKIYNARARQLHGEFAWLNKVNGEVL